MGDILQVEGINSKGYGIIPKLVMQDRRLTTTAKAIYAYFCSYAGAGKTAFPRVTRIAKDLDLSKNSYHKHFKLLRDFGYVKAEQIHIDGRLSHNIYTLLDEIPIEIQSTRICDTVQCTKIQDTVKQDTVFCDTNNNNSIEKEQVLKSNSSSTATAAISQFWTENGFGKLSAKVKAEINGHLDKGVPPDLIIAVLGECVDHNVLNWAYARRILARLDAEGINTADAFKATRAATGPHQRHQKPKEGDILSAPYKPLYTKTAASAENTGNGPEQDASKGNPSTQTDCTTLAGSVQEEQEE